MVKSGKDPRRIVEVINGYDMLAAIFGHWRFVLFFVFLLFMWGRIDTIGYSRNAADTTQATPVAKQQ